MDKNQQKVVSPVKHDAPKSPVGAPGRKDEGLAGKDASGNPAPRKDQPTGGQRADSGGRGKA